MFLFPKVNGIAPASRSGILVALIVALAAWGVVGYFWFVQREHAATNQSALTGRPATGKPRDKSLKLTGAAEGFKPIRVIPPMEAITEVPVMSAEKAGGILHEADLVLGVSVEGQARAYPINMLTGPYREIINDVLGERAIAATW